jgi:tripartite ATP-independent transporter DctM subunit
MLFLLVVLLALIGTPLFAVIAAGALVGYREAGIDYSAITIELYRIAETPVLVAIPLFTFAGYVLSESGAPGRLVRITQAFFGWMPGGLALVALGACALFTAFSGATGVTIIALGALLYPALEQAGYPQRFNLGLVTTGGCLGLLFAPSLPLILYGVVAQQMPAGAGVSITDLFKAGALPGVLMIVLLGGYAILVHRRHGVPLTAFSARAAWFALRECAWELPLPLVVLGGIYGGYFAVSEAAAVTVLYVLLVEVVVHREVRWIELPQVMRQSMVLVGGIMVILGASLALTNVLIDAGIPERLAALVTAHVSSPLMFLLLLNLFLLALGSILNVFSAIVLVVPLLLPVAVGYGVDPLHFGIIFLANLQIGFLMPPAGLDLFISSFRFNTPIPEVARACLPFIGLLLVSVIIITYWPALSLALVR